MTAAVRVDTECGRQFVHGDQQCRRTIKHPGLHRDARRMVDSGVMWGDNECIPEKGRK